MPPTTGAVRSIRLSDAQIEALLDDLDSRAPTGNFHERVDERYRYRVPSCVVRIGQSHSASEIAYLVPTRNLSAGGIAVLHGNYVHPKTPCQVRLISAHGSWESVGGFINACHHIKGLIHEIAIRFERKIDVGMYCPDAVKLRILLADDDPLVGRLVERHLYDMNAELTHVDDGNKAVDEVMKQVFDLVLMDIEMPVMDGFDATKKLRESGYSGRIVAATGFTGAEEREKCLKAGCDAYLPKPYTRQALRDLLRSLQQEPLFSSMSNDASMVDLINSFVEDLPARLRAIEEAYANRDAAMLETLSRRLKGEAGGYGFDPITDAAAALEQAIKDNPDVQAIKTYLDTVITYCQLARTSTPKTL